jgi:hypothetical protein
MAKFFNCFAVYNFLSIFCKQSGVNKLSYMTSVLSVEAEALSRDKKKG